MEVASRADDHDMLSIAGLGSAYGGLQASTRAFDRAAASVADPNGDLIDGMVGSTVAADSFQANVAVIKTADEMLGTLLDTFA